MSPGVRSLENAFLPLTPDEIADVLTRADRVLQESRELSELAAASIVQHRADDRGIPQPLGLRQPTKPKRR